MATDSPVDQSNDTHGFSKSSQYYILAMLTLAYVFNFIDRQVLAIL